MYEEHMKLKYTDENHCRLCANFARDFMPLLRAKYLCKLQDYAPAVYLYDKVIEYIKETDKNNGNPLTPGSRQRIANVLEKQAKAYEGWQKFDKAMEVLQEAEAILDGINPEDFYIKSSIPELEKDKVTVKSHIAALQKKINASQTKKGPMSPPA